MGERFPRKEIPTFKDDYKNDILTIRWLKRKEDLDIILKKGDDGKTVKYRNIYVDTVQSPEVPPPEVEPSEVALKKSPATESLDRAYLGVA